jgi:putative ABC transport system permease protein
MMTRFDARCGGAPVAVGSICGQASALARTVRLALRFAWRELRGGLNGFAVFIGCIALGVMAIAGVGSVAASLADGLADAGQAILGGDLAVSLIQREADDRERAWLDRQGTVSVAATTRAMARTRDGRTVLVEIKAVDAAYPLYGSVATEPAMPLWALLARRGDAFGAAVDPALLARLNLKTGDRVTIGNDVIELRAALTREPDALADGIGLGPRMLLSEAALRASGLLQPGSLVRWHYRLRLPASARTVTNLEQELQAAFPNAGWDIRTRSKASPQLDRTVERFTQFLTLVALTTLLVGGVGVANAVVSLLARKRDVLGTLKALGATGGDVFAIYCGEIFIVALFATAIGTGLGAALPFVMSAVFATIIPLPFTPAVHAAVLGLSIAYGLLTALAFALWPLGRAHDASASMLFRDRITAERRWPRLSYMIATALIVAAFAALAIFTGYDRRIAAIYIASAGAVLVMLRLVAMLLLGIARRLPRPRSALLRQAVVNIYRPGALTSTVMLSLGLGIALLTTVIEIDSNLHREFAAALPEKAPSFFFLDIASTETERFDAFVQARAPGAVLERVPMLRGRIVAAKGIKAEDLKPAAGRRWVLRGDRGITYSSVVPPGSRVVAGHWWDSGSAGEPLVSLENTTAQDLNLKIGDSITVNVLGRNITARIANLRAVDWENLGINFVLVFSPGTFSGAPHSDIATLTFADGGTTAEETALVNALGEAFPTVTAVRMKDTLEALGGIVSRLVLALRGASFITLLAAALVLGGALAASQELRIYDAVVLKTLGAKRVQLLATYALEYLLVGLAAVGFGVAIGSVAAWLIVSDVMTLPFVWAAWQAAGVALVALVVTVVLGLAGTLTALSRKPAEVLRNL